MEGSQPHAELHYHQRGFDRCVLSHCPVVTTTCLLEFITIGGTVLGIMLLVTFVISIGAIVQRNHITMGLVVLNWVLIMDFIAVVVVGTYIWFYTLQERNNYFERFKAVTPDVRAQIQDHVRPPSLNFDCNDIDTGVSRAVPMLRLLPPERHGDVLRVLLEPGRRQRDVQCDQPGSVPLCGAYNKLCGHDVEQHFLVRPYFPVHPSCDPVGVFKNKCHAHC